MGTLLQLSYCNTDYSSSKEKKPLQETKQSAMGGTEFFKQPVPYNYTIDGSINGQKFTIEGQGVGNSEEGTLKGRYTCTSGKCPMSWKALAPILGYGLKIYVNYPVGMTQFFQETMPSGYSEDRVFKYEDGGIVKSHREITMQNGVIISKGTFVAENFPEDSPIHTQKLKSPVPPQEVITPYKNGVRSMCNFVFPTESGEHYAADLVTINLPLRETNDVPRPGAHYQRTQFKQMKDLDANMDDDHVIQQEVLEAYQCSLIDNVYNA